MFGLSWLGIGKWFLSAGSAAGRFIVAHPMQIAIAVLALATWHYHGKMKSIETEYAQACALVNAKPSCKGEISAVVVSRDQYKIAFGVAAGNYSKAKQANGSLSVALDQAEKVNSENEDEKAAAQGRAAAALAKLRTAQRQLAEANQRAQTMRNQAYASESCSAWATAPVCDDVANLLRVSAGPPAAAGGGHHVGADGGAGAAPVRSDPGGGNPAPDGAALR
jgi:hypothetical protein